MYPRTKYEMTPEDLEKILEACKSTPAIMLHIGGGGSTPQERANAAWAELGSRMGFDSTTVQPSGAGNLFFTAVPSETPDQKAARIAKEKDDKRNKRIEELQSKRDAIQAELDELIAVIDQRV